MGNLYLFWKRLQAVTGAARRWESRTLPVLPKTINWGALHVTPSPAFKSSSSMKNPAQTQRAATPRAARGPAPVAVSAERGRGRGLGRSRLPCSRGCGGRAVFGRTGRLQAPPARPPEHKRWPRVTPLRRCSQPAAARRGCRRRRRRLLPPTPRHPAPRSRCTAPARPASAAGGAATARCRCRYHAAAPGFSRGTHRAASAAAPARHGAEPRCQPNVRRCSGPQSCRRLLATCARPRSAARPGSASPLLAAPGLIFCSSLAAVVGLLPPGQLLFCTALSPFPAISNLHALSFLRYRLILVWRRFAVLSQAHSCGWMKFIATQVIAGNLHLRELEDINQKKKRGGEGGQAASI